MIHINEFFEKCSCDCSHDLHLYIVLADALCACVLLIVVYLILSQLIRYIHEWILLFFCK